MSSIFSLPMPLQAASPPGLERLFTTVEQRHRLDRLRHKGVSPGQAIKSEDASVHVQHVTIDGIVVGRDGRQLLWVNGQEQDAGRAMAVAGIKIRLLDKERVAVNLPKKHHSILVKPGQVLELDSGKVREAYEMETLDHAP